MRPHPAAWPARPARLAALCAVAIACLAPAGVTAAPSAPLVRAMPLLAAGGRDGVWFSDLRFFRDGHARAFVGHIAPSGAVRERPLPASSGPGGPAEAFVTGLAAGTDGSVWYAGAGAWLARIAPDGTIRRFPSTVAGPGWGDPVSAIGAAPDGDLWFTEGGDGVGRVTPAGEATTWHLPPGRIALDIASGPDGRLWIVLARRRADRFSETIAVMSTEGVITPLGPATPFSGTQAIDDLTLGPDGGMWFTEGDRIGRISPAGDVRFSGLPTVARGGDVLSLTAGPDGDLWFSTQPSIATTEGDLGIGRVTPAGAITLFLRGVEAESIAAGPDGNLWFTQPNEGRIGRITPDGVVGHFPPRPAIARLRPAGGHGAIATLRCPVTAATSCAGTITLQQPESPHPARYGVARFDLAPGRTETVRIPLWRTGRAALSSRRVLPLSAVVRPRSPLTGVLGGESARRVTLRIAARPAVSG